MERRYECRALLSRVGVRNPRRRTHFLPQASLRTARAPVIVGARRLRIRHRSGGRTEARRRPDQRGQHGRRRERRVRPDHHSGDTGQPNQRWAPGPKWRRPGRHIGSPSSIPSATETVGVCGDPDGRRGDPRAYATPNKQMRVGRRTPAKRPPSRWAKLGLSGRRSTCV